jgi:hypothetical protein
MLAPLFIEETPMLKRSLLAASVTAIAGLITYAGDLSAQQANRPAIETTKVPGTDNVYIFRNVNHQAMFIVTKAGVIATDPHCLRQADRRAGLCQ